MLHDKTVYGYNVATKIKKGDILKMKRSNKKGFTIVELVIVIAIIAVLAAVLIPTFAGVIRKANVSKNHKVSI